MGGYLKIAPEDSEEGPLSKMMKPGMDAYDEFKAMFEKFSAEAGKKQYLIPYFIAAHPGTTDDDMLNLALWLKKYDFKLDQVQTKYPDRVLLHGGSPKGAELIAAKWAEARGVTQVAFKPDWTKHAKAAPFKRNDAMLDVLPVGILVFPGNGIQENLADKAAGFDTPEEASEISDILFDLTRRETRAYSHVFARTLVSVWKDAAGLNKNPQRSAGFKVLQAPDVPSVLLELGYLSSQKDAALLTTPEWREKTAGAVARSIDSFFAMRGPGRGAAGEQRGREQDDGGDSLLRRQDQDRTHGH